MIVYYVGPGAAAPGDRTFARTQAEAHALAKTMHRRDPVIVRAEVESDARGVVAALNGEPALTPLEAWTLTPRGGLRPLPLPEIAS